MSSHPIPSRSSVHAVYALTCDLHSDLVSKFGLPREQAVANLVDRLRGYLKPALQLQVPEASLPGLGMAAAVALLELRDRVQEYAMSHTTPSVGRERIVEKYFPSVNEANFRSHEDIRRLLVNDISTYKKREKYSSWFIFLMHLQIAVGIWGYPESAEQGSARIVREIHFPPEYQQAGIGILSYFSVILKQKLPASDTSVTIQQLENRVVLTIRYPNGQEETVSELLTSYNLVVSGRATPETLLTDSLAQSALRQKLEIANLELRLARDHLVLERRHSDQRFSGLESEIHYLREQLSIQIEAGSTLRSKLLDNILESLLVRDESHSILLENVVDAIVRRDEVGLRASTEKLAEEAPSLLDRAHAFFLSSSIGGVLGNATYDWLRILWPVLPK